MKEYADQNPSENLDDNETEKNISEDNFKEDALELATMSFKEKMSYKNKLHKNRMAEMDKKEKVSYLINYYKWFFIVGVLAIICLAYTGRVIYRATWPTYLELAIVNNQNDFNFQSYVADSYRTYYSLDNKNFIEIYNNLSVSEEEDTTEVGLTMSNYQTIGYYNMYDMLDVIICDKNALNLFVSTDDTTAIDLSMDADLYNQIKDHVITMSDPKGIKNDGNPYTVALDISDTQFVKDANFSYNEVYLLIPSTKYTDNENTLQFIKYVFGL